MRPSRVHTLTRTVGSISTRSRMMRSSRASAAGSPASTAAEISGATTPRARASVTVRASSSASPVATWRSARAPIVPTTSRTATLRQDELGGGHAAPRPAGRPQAEARARRRPLRLRAPGRLGRTALPLQAAGERQQHRYAGNRIQKVAPTPGRLAMPTEPPCAAATRRTRASPRPGRSSASDIR